MVPFQLMVTFLPFVPLAKKLVQMVKNENTVGANGTHVTNPVNPEHTHMYYLHLQIGKTLNGNSLPLIKMVPMSRTQTREILNLQRLRHFFPSRFRHHPLRR